MSLGDIDYAKPLYLYADDFDSGWSASIVGGKTSALRKLAFAGVRVPDGVALPVKLLRDCLDSAVLSEARRSASSALGITAIAEACREYHHQVQSLVVPGELVSLINSTIRRLGGARFAVRSSAAEEDGLRSSWAGQFDSFLDVPADGVSQMVVACWASLVSPRSVFYSRSIGVDLHNMGMSVLIQKFIPADMSGVVFTKNPLDGDSSVIYVEAVHGLCEKLVTGRVIPDQYIVRKWDGHLLHQIVSQQTYGGEWQSERHDASMISEVTMHPKPVLKSSNLKDILEMCTIVENRFGMPQDIEFAVWCERLYALQSRPITT